MHSNNSSSRTMRPKYSGSTGNIPPVSVNINTYFRETVVVDWDLVDFLLSGQKEETFLTELGRLANVKSLARDVQRFAGALRLFYSVEQNLIIARNDAKERLNRNALRGFEHRVVQNELQTGLMNDLSSYDRVQQSSPTATHSVQPPTTAASTASTSSSLDVINAAGQKRPRDALDDDGGLPEKASDAVETFQKVNQRQSKRTSSKKTTSTPANTLKSAIPSSISDTKKRRRTERFQRLDASKFWRLGTGKCVEESLFKASLTVDATIKIRSYTIDFECQATRKLFTDEEWVEIECQNHFALPLLPETTVEYLLKVKQAIIDRQPVVGVSLPTEDRVSSELILETFRVWERIYRKVPSPFVVQDLSEAYWGRKSWPLLMELLEDQDNIFMIDGEKMGLESSRRRNNGRQWKPDTKALRKLIARDVMDQKDWMIVERMEKWDKVSNKFLKESSCDLFRETHTIMTSRLQDTMNMGFKDEARFFGVYSGDRGFQSFELRPAGVGTYVSLFKQYPVYELPTLVTDMKAHVQGIVHLLQLRLSMLNTIEAYRCTEEESEEQDNNWIYGNIHSGRDMETTLASSPIASPSPSDVTTFMPEEESSSAPTRSYTSHGWKQH
ncbi:hypothetical protein BGZ65_002468 [Modicella reniformis]|uniref:Uncharacterized protein n=1 Tax=Modicella reniformis TaxID=1440133 RepID=A0A9P6MJ71_9FUNG|nr:hypothetical protein BGZ65_002468 [Modicella reniformis]